MNVSEKKIKASNFFLVILCAIIVIALIIGSIALGRFIYDLAMDRLIETVLSNSIFKIIFLVVSFYSVTCVALILFKIIGVFKDGIINVILPINIGIILTIIINKQLHNDTIRQIVIILDTAVIMISVAVSIGMKIMSPVISKIGDNIVAISELKNKKDE